MNINNKNILYPLIIGELCFALLLLVLSSVSSLFSFDYNLALISLVGAITFPLLTLLVMKVAEYGVKYLESLFQLAKFALVGVLNTLVDLGVFTLLSIFFGVGSTFIAATYKAIAFMVAVLNSFFFNKTWVFEGKSSSKSLLGEILSFLSVSVAGLIVNVVAFLLALTLLSYSGLPEAVIRIGAALIASITALAWNFLGYKFLVFK